MDDFDEEYFDEEENMNEGEFLEEDEEIYDEDGDLYEEITPAQNKKPSKPTPVKKSIKPSTPDSPLAPKKPRVITNSLAHNEDIPLDIIETLDTIYVRAEITGIDPDTVDIDLTRDSLVLNALKKERRIFGDNEYLHREIFWGDVTRSIDLPDEVEVEEAEAHAEFGILMVTLPKIDKARKTKLKVGTKTKPAVRKE